MDSEILTDFYRDTDRRAALLEYWKRVSAEVFSCADSEFDGFFDDSESVQLAMDLENGGSDG